MESIKIKINGTQAQLVSCPVLTGGTVGQPVEFIFDEVWEGLNKTAVFRADGLTVDRLDVETQTTVPWEVMEKSGCRLFIGVYGTNGDGSVAIPTIWVKTDPMAPGADPSGDESTDPTLPVWAQLNQSAIKTVNGKKPDEEGNVQIETGGGVSPKVSIEEHTLYIKAGAEI